MPVPRAEWDRRAAALKMAWVGGTPTNSRDKHMIQCLNCGREWMVRPHSVGQGHGCLFCVRARSPEQWRALAAAVGAEWIGTPPRNTTDRRSLRCGRCGHEWATRGGNIARGNGCRPCSDTARGLSAEEWERRANEAGAEWLDDPMGKGTRCSVRCLACGHEWRIAKYRLGETGCPACASSFPISSERWSDLANAAGIEWVNGPPQAVTAHATARCVACGFQWDAYGGTIRKGSGCPSCASYGFDRAAPAIVYLLRHDRGPLMKVGVAGTEGVRLTRHESLGWEVHGMWAIPSGREAEEIEGRVLEWWRAQEAQPCRRDEMPGTNGFTEAIHIGVVDVPDTLTFIDALMGMQPEA